MPKSASVSTSGCASLTVSPSASASTYAFDSASGSTSACASRPACRPVAAHISMCPLVSLLHLCLRLSQRVDHCLRKSASVSTIDSASLNVSHSASAPPLHATQPACRPLLPQVGRRVEKSLCSAQCVALRFCLSLSWRVRKRVDQGFRKAATVSSGGFAYLCVSPSV